ncbi:bifunctional enoyl-CoA hydratase/phosphate acetyltransferase [Alkaliphilus serpentinus]|uniref:Bifunctional enoyl-CoA hydratase/phosphate acetyltransferase n=1 Tax=Alkaliphilus serpentinus TaxID=1482731 RepID=A0A833HND3_9FIRM|nr:bifunctional enoyl-CoA hydratase/phosphate acetyltransferase [Alkaliphilus serpentinus]KAB3529227.1 bifunctional enoyl-CoA hydratase/phosphate acetyltransferase [Alkaliphilus serpentinus]
MIKNLAELIKQAKTQMKMKLAVAAAQDHDVLMAVKEAQELGIIEGILVGDEEEIKTIAKEISMDLSKFEVINKADLMEAALKAVSLVSSGAADFVMKGIIDTSILLKAVLDKEVGLRTDRLLSHVMVYELEAYHKLLFLTDGGMNIQPSLEEKKGILMNAVLSAKALGNKEVKVACLAAKEKVSEKMPSTVDGAELKNLAGEGAFGDGVMVEGPIAFDLAVSKEAAEIKGYKSSVAGEADIILVPTIEVGNGVGKALTYMAHGKSAGIIMGAKAPVVLVSRADTAETKLYSIALGSVVAANK